MHFTGTCLKKHRDKIGTAIKKLNVNLKHKTTTYQYLILKPGLKCLKNNNDH